MAGGLVGAGFDLGDFGPAGDGIDGDPGPPDPARSRTLAAAHGMKNGFIDRRLRIKALQAHIDELDADSETSDLAALGADFKAL